MTAALLARARAAGLTLRVDDRRLALSGRKPDADLLAELRAARDDLIQELKIEAGEVSPRGSATESTASPSAPSGPGMG
jgi:hypothetical protein